MRSQTLRLKELTRLRQKLEQNGIPRLQMFLIVTISGAAGFIASFLMLDAGLTEMWLRYAYAVGAAYLMFLFLLWLWLKTSADDYTDFPDLSGISPSSGRSGESAYGYDGKGGDFGGGGAQGSYDGPAHTHSVSFEPADSSSTIDGDVIGEALGGAAQAEELAIPLVVLVLLGAMLFSSFFIVYSAPMLFAELLLDAALAAGLYRRLRRLETRHWLETAIRRTVWPFIMTTVMIAAAGWGMQVYAPEAHSIGEVIAHNPDTKSD